jgi:hypothetical protein
MMVQCGSPLEPENASKEKEREDRQKLAGLLYAAYCDSLRTSPQFQNLYPNCIASAFAVYSGAGAGATSY